MTKQQDPPWLAIARQSLGVTETPGKATTPAIRKWLVELRAWWTDDETPWCGVALAAWMNAAGMPLPKHWYRARDWLNWGMVLDEPALGCVVVFDGGPTRPGAGHVGLCVGRNGAGALMVLGGNQGNRVSIAPFSPSRVLGYRFPIGPAAGVWLDRQLPMLASNGQPLSTVEA